MSRASTLPIRAGQLRRRFTVQERIEVQDSYGQPTVTFRTLTTLRGHLSSLRGDERIRGQQAEAHVTHRITTRYPTAPLTPDKLDRFTSKLRLVDDRSRIFDVRAVYDPDDRRRALVWDVEGEGI